ncbi:MAG: hypothetical protein AAF687_01545 [Pseudomonadota bacterium]
MKKLMTAMAATALLASAPTATAAPPRAAFDGVVQEVFVNDASVLVLVSGRVDGSCTGRFGPYNLTFEMSDPNGREKFEMVMKAMQNGFRIGGYLKGCGSSGINKLWQVAIYP